MLTTPFTNTVDSVIAKIDQHLAAAKDDLLTGRYYFGNSHQSFPLAIVGGGMRAGFQHHYSHARAGRFAVVHPRHHPKMLIEFRGGWNRFAEQFFAAGQQLQSRLDWAEYAAAGRYFARLRPAADRVRRRYSDHRGQQQRAARTHRHQLAVLHQRCRYNTGAHNYKAGFELRRTTVNGFFD